MKDTQASVEVTSYGQMDNIFEYGCYRIGIKQPLICKSRDEVISLTLKEKKEKSEKRLAKMKFNLEDLRDLESKLVLITGRNAENRKMVDLFVDVRRLHLIVLAIARRPHACHISSNVHVTFIHIHVTCCPHAWHMSSTAWVGC